jgi:glycosyltransferase involved in cell wall biosynthesis
MAMAEAPTLTYALTTRNRLPTLKLVLAELLADMGADEELIVADAGSSDGTPDYLAELKDEGKLAWFCSEPDRGEGHGFNKCLLQARGDVVKFISDDDVFDFAQIRACRNFMLEHPDVDALAVNGIDWWQAAAPAASDERLHLIDNEQRFFRWLKTGRPFAFSTLSLMLRRESLPLLGLTSPQALSLDTEYTLRLTHNRAKLAVYTGRCFARLLHAESSSERNRAAIVAESVRLNRFYEVPKYSWLHKLAPGWCWQIYFWFKMRQRKPGTWLLSEESGPIMEECRAALKRLNTDSPGKFHTAEPHASR